MEYPQDIAGLAGALLIGLVVTLSSYLLYNRKLLSQKATTKLRIEALYFYPVKGLRGCPIKTGKIGPLGFQDDRCFCLQRVRRDPGTKDIKLYESLHAGLTLELVLFSTSIDESSPKEKYLVVTWTGPENPDVQAGQESVPWMGAKGEQRSKFQIRIPFHPATGNLHTLHVDMHGATTAAFDMGDEISTWFSKYLGFEARMAYLGPQNSRPVLGSGAPNSDLAVRKRLPSVLYHLRQLLIPAFVRAKAERISFCDIAQFLVVTTESNAELTRRLREDTDNGKADTTVEMDVTKFRPNIVLSGSPAAFDEDYWSELAFLSRGNGSSIRMSVTLNCWRCQSIVVDYNTGKPATDASGLAWKKLSRDRRVDKGWKYNPVFGRYGFCATEETGKSICVGDEVLVTRRAPEISVFDWPLSKASASAYKS